MKKCFLLTALGMALAALSGCASLQPRDIPAKLYSLQDGVVTPGIFFWQGKLKGPVSVQRAQETCPGEFNTIIEGRSSSAQSWGQIFSASSSSSSTEHAQKGTAIAVCPSSVVYECEYVVNLTREGPSGHGACKDNRSGTYRLMF